MNILEQIIDNHGISTTTPISPVTTAMATLEGLSVYRGFGRTVDTYSSDEELLKKLKLDWKVCERPVLVQGVTENRVFEGKKALVRCDNGDMIDIVSGTFKSHQNSEIIAGMGEVVDALGGRVRSGGYFPATGRVFVSAGLKMSFDVSKGDSNAAAHSFVKGAMGKDGVRNGDIVDLEVIITGGHKPGTPRKVKAVAKRRVCTNTATVCEVLAVIERVTHRRKITAQVLQEVEQAMQELAEQFEGYGHSLKALANVEASKALQQAYLMELTAPNLLGRIVNQQMLSGAELIQEILDRDEQFSRHDPEWFTRLVNREASRRGDDIEVPRIYGQINNVRDTQPGVEFTRGTLANAYNATTYFVDHLRGRQGGSAAIESALDGEGDKLKTRALRVATEFAQNVRQARG